MLSKTIKILLFLTALTPLIWSSYFIFPYVSAKMFFFRGLIEITVFLALIQSISDENLRQKAKKIFRNPIFLSLVSFLIISGIASIFSVNPSIAFFGNLERGEGFISLVHYFVFFFLISIFFEARDFLRFLIISFWVGIGVTFLGFFQRLGLDNLPFVPPYKPDFDSTLGNRAYVAGYSLFLIGSSLFLFLEKNTRSFMRYWYGGGIILFSILLLLTNNRGSLVALFVSLLITLGIIAFHSSSLVARRAKIAGICLVLFGLCFFITRSFPIWQYIPGLSRVANISLSDATMRTRYLSLISSLNAFKEKPLLGWGNDHFITAYNKYYEPSYARFENSWFDRAHNKLAEILVETGLIGLLAYLSIFLFVFLFLRKEGLRKETLILGSIFIAYFLQNLFLFDHPTSYLLFYFFLAFLIIRSKEEVKNIPSSQPLSFSFIPLGGLVIYLPLLLYCFTYLEAKPIKAAYAANMLSQKDSLWNEKPELINMVITGSSFSKIDTHRFLMGFINSRGLFMNKAWQSKLFPFLHSYEGLVIDNKYDPRINISLSDAYEDLGEKDPGFLDKKLQVLESALPLAPRRQDLFYELAFAHSLKKENEKAIEIARSAIALDPEVARAHYVLSAILYLAKADKEESIRELALTFEYPGAFLSSQDQENIKNILITYLANSVKSRDEKGVTSTATLLKKVIPEKIGEFDQIIALGKAHNWYALEYGLDIK